MRSPLCLSSCPRRSLVLLSSSLILLAGCGGGDGIVLPDEGEPAAIAVVEGNDQRGRVGEPLNDPLVVQVTDSRGRPVRGATVAFEFGSAGPGAAVVPEEKTTDGDGLADARLVLGTSIGRQTGQARVVLEAGREPIEASFSAMALPENANTMAAVAGQDQTGHVGSPLDDRLVVEVTDGFGNPVAGVPISWLAVGGGSVSEALVETDEDGRSRVDRTLGPTVGQQTTVASAEGLAGSPVTFQHTALAGDASRLVIVSGNEQTAEVGSVLPGELVVQLIDADGNGVPQTAVSWVVATGGGAATPEVSTTDGDGRTSARWTLGGALGQQRLDAVVSGVGIASFRATATAGAPASLFILTQPPATARNGVLLTRQPVLQLRDTRGNDAAQAGVQITVGIGSGGGELGGTRLVSTDASGQATFTNLSISGAPGPRTLVFSAEGYAQVTSSEIDLQAIGTTTTITGDSPDPSGAGTAFTVSFRVASQGPTPTGSVTVGDGLQSCTGALASGAGSCQLALTTAGARTLTATYAGVPGLLGSSDTEPHTVVPPLPPNRAPDADFNWNCEDLTCFFTDGSEDPDGTIANRVWNFGDGSSVQNELNPSHTYAAAGEYTVTLTVTDNGGLTDQASDKVDPEAPPPPNLPPTATFTWRCNDLDCEFSDESNDSDGNIKSRAWEFGDGTTGSGASPSHTYTAGGTYTVTLTVTDNDGATGTATATIQVQAPPQLLQLRTQPSGSATVGVPFGRQPVIQLRAGGDDVETPGVIVSATIGSGGGTLGGGTTATTDGNGRAEFSDLRINGATGPHTLRFAAPGFAEIISNSINVGKASSTTQITSDEPEPSIAGSVITVDVQVSSALGTPTGTVTVSVSGPSPPPPCTQTLSNGAASCQLTLDAEGDRVLTADYSGDGLHDESQDQEDHHVDPVPEPPNVLPTAAFSPPSCTTGQPCDFTDSSSDSDGTISSWSWNFGDFASPASSSDQSPAGVTFAPAGTYPVTLTVTDNDGDQDSVTEGVTVTD